MRILSRKKIEFKIGDGSTLVVEPLVFTEAPESIKNDPMFGWALKDGSIEVIETAAQQKKLENEPLVQTRAPEEDKEPEGLEITKAPEAPEVVEDKPSKKK